MPPETCPTKRELLGKTEQVLARIVDLTSEQLRAIRDPDTSHFIRLDKELELSIDEKERLFGALREHRAEHGC
jgi:hypothetical protein